MSDPTPATSGEPLRFDGRVAIVTGAGRGLGRAYALALAARGARVVVNDSGGSLTGAGSDPAPARAVVDEIIAAGGEAIVDLADVTGAEAGEALVASALERFGGLDIVVNNAGNMDPKPLSELRVADLDAHLAVHALGALELTRSAWPHLIGKGYGRVVFTTSVGLFGGPFIAAYSAAKGAVFSLGRSLAPAGEEHGILVNLLAPAADTRMVTDPELRAKVNLPPREEGLAPDAARAPEAVVPMLLALVHESCPSNGETFIAGFGRFARIFAAETRGVFEPGIAPEALLERWPQVLEESGYVVQPTTAAAVAFREGLIAEASALRPSAPNPG